MLHGKLVDEYVQPPRCGLKDVMLECVRCVSTGLGTYLMCVVILQYHCEM